MQSSFLVRRWRPWAAAGLSAGLLELPFPFAGPMPPWRSVFAWFALVPLLWALLSDSSDKDKGVTRVGHPPSGVEPDRRHPLRRAFLISYLCGVLWYAGNCYWIRDTMMHYGDMPPLAPELLTLGFSLVLGLYFGIFGLGLVVVRRATGSTRVALAVAPFLWVGLDLAAARITSVPWDQLGYSQIDNALINQLAPFTGVYGITFVLVAVNALLAGGLIVECGSKSRFAGRWGGGVAALQSAFWTLAPAINPPASSAFTATRTNDAIDASERRELIDQSVIDLRVAKLVPWNAGDPRGRKVKTNPQERSNRKCHARGTRRPPNHHKPQPENPKVEPEHQTESKRE